MNSGNGSQIHRISEAGVTASHPAFEEADFRVAPTFSEEFNRLRSCLWSVASWRLEDIHFEFDSSFVLPWTFDAGQLKALIEKHPGARISIFGHADPVGQDPYNKELSGRRAQAIYALLTRKPELWEDLYLHHGQTGADEWGLKSVQIMLNRLGFVTGRSDGVANETTKEKLQEFQSGNGLPASGMQAGGRADSATFQKLARAYMDAICQDSEFNQVQLAPDDFLARGSGKDGKGDYQGCGEFNPLLVFSTQEQSCYDQPEHRRERNNENRPNRRVILLLFRPGTQVDPEKWPCPTVKEGTGGCIKRFWSDGEKRRSNQARRREYKDTQDTFACRFYDRISYDTVGLNFMVFKLQVHDPLFQPCPNAEYVLNFPSGQAMKGRADGDGWIYGKAPRSAQKVDITYKPADQDVEFKVTAALEPPEAESEASYLAHMRNFGFGTEKDDTRSVILKFQAAHPKLQLSGELDQETRKAVDEILEKTLNGEFEEN